MSELSFAVVDVRPEKFAAVPTLTFDLKIDTPGESIHSLALRCQIRIEPQRRRYSAEEQARLMELFGEPPRWGDTLKPFLWTHASAILPGFQETVTYPLAVPCSYDFEVAAAKYLHSLGDGEVPLILLFSGTVFAKNGTGLKVTQVPWHEEATYRLPVRVWRDLMDLYFPDSGWMRLRRENMSALLDLKAKRALATFDELIEQLLRSAERLDS